MNLFSLRNRPLTIVIGFNLLTLFVFFTAPIRWETNNLYLFLFFSLFCQIMIVLGYKIGYRKYVKTNVSHTVLNTISNTKLNFIFLFYLFTILIKYAYLLKFNLFDIKGMFSFLMLGIANPLIGYQLSIEASRPYTISWSIYFLISIINQVFFIIGFIKWRDMGRFKKYLFILLVVIELFYWMGRATSFGIIAMITTFSFSIIDKFRSKKLNIRQTLLFSFRLLLLLIGSISVFINTMNNRARHIAIDLKQFDLGISKVDEYQTAFSIVPQSLHQSYMYIVYYLSQGYYHTCLAFDLDFKSTYFLGNNPALISLASAINIDVWEDTYIYRLREKGVDPLVNWHSAYVWYASDVSFFGVPFLLFIIGYMFGISWALSLNNKDFLSKIMFIILGNMLLFLFANNSYISSVFYSFIFILPIWYFTRVKRFK